jgi:phage gp37-like protein
MPYAGYSIEEIEAAMVATLRDDPTLASYVRTFDRLPWERVDELEKLVKLYPAVLAAYAGGDDSDSVAGATDHNGRFIVLCCARNIRSPAAPLSGEGGGKGIYDMLEDVFDCLNHATLGLDIDDCQSLRVVPLVASAQVVVFSREFSVEWRKERV